MSASATGTSPISLLVVDSTCVAASRTSSHIELFGVVEAPLRPSNHGKIDHIGTP